MTDQKREIVEQVSIQTGWPTNLVYRFLEAANHFELREAAEKAQDTLEDAYQVVNNLMPLGEYDGLIDKIERAQMAYKDALKGGGE